MVAVLGLLLVPSVANGTPSDYTQSVAAVDASHARVLFTPTTPASYVIAHYQVPTQVQQNVQMANAAGVWHTTIGGLATGASVTYWFTYEKNGPQYDTPSFTYVQGAGATTTTTAPPATTTTAPPSGGPSSGYAQHVTRVDASHAQVSFTPATSAAYVDIHYLVANIPQQNLRMSTSNGTWQDTIGGLASGTAINYWFTYEKNGTQYDTPTFTYVQEGGAGLTGGGTTTTTSPSSTTTTTIAAPLSPTDVVTEPVGLPGAYPVTFQNNTHGAWSNGQIYVTIFGQASPGQWSFVRADGSTVHVNHLDATAPGHLTKNGVNYPNMSFTLAQASTIQMPPNIQGGRIYLSVGSPLYIVIPPDDSGWAGPDPNNPNDPNANVYYGWYEFTFVAGQLNYAGNTTQVDMFGLPLTSRVQQASSGFDQTNGINLTRQQVMSEYAASVGTPFKSLENSFRIISPRTSPQFGSGGAQAGYFNSAIGQFWTYYASHPFTFNEPGFSYGGQVVGNRLRFSENGAGPYFVTEPTSQDVAQCSNTLASGVPPELRLEADLCAAFNRGVALTPTDWNTPADYFSSSPDNSYAQFFHSISIGNLAYDFAYDDVNGQSAVAILPNSQPPSRLTIGVGW